MDNYFGHLGPVFKVQTNPLLPEYFITCGNDWNIKIWHSKENEALLTIKSEDLESPVNNIDWCPFISTVFASCTKDGRIEIRDLNEFAQTAVVTWLKPEEGENIDYTTLKFSPINPVLIVGKSKGGVDVFRLVGFDEQTQKPVNEQIEELKKHLEKAKKSKSGLSE